MLERLLTYDIANRLWLVKEILKLQKKDRRRKYHMKITNHPNEF